MQILGKLGALRMQVTGASFGGLRLPSSCRSLTGMRLSRADGITLGRGRVSQVPLTKICCMHASAADTVPAPSQALNGGERRVFVDYTFYKTKCAMNLRPLKPTFRLIDKGGASLDKEGTVFLEFANSIGVRHYDWSKKQIFSLAVGEIGQLISLGPTDSCEFYHDPNMGKSDQGKVRKSLKVEPMGEKQGFFFNFTVVNKIENVEEKYNMAITKPEYFVMKTAFTYILPYLMGWHIVAHPSMVGELMDRPIPEGIVTDGATEWAR